MSTVIPTARFEKDIKYYIKEEKDISISVRISGR